MFGNFRTFTKGGAIGVLPENCSSYARKIINIEKILASYSPITEDILFDAVNQHTSDKNPTDLKLLLDRAFTQKNINPNITNSLGLTALNMIITDPIITEQNRKLITELFLKYGALTELKDLNDWTVIQWAVVKGKTEIIQLLILYGANPNVITPHSRSVNSNKNLIELAPEEQPELKAFLKLAIACNNNDWGIVDESVITEDIQKFTEWKISAKPENPKFFSKHLNELYCFKIFLLTKEEFKESEFIGKIDDNLNSYSTLKNLLMFKMVEQPDIYKYKAGILPEDLENDLKDYGLKLTGEIKAKEI